MYETPAVAKAAGMMLDLVQCGIGGCPLEKHWANLEKSGDASFRPYGIIWSYASDPKKIFPKTANLTEMLCADKWDIVTIQQASGKSAFYDTYQPYADKLIAKIHELAPQAEIVVQETWSYTPYDERLTSWSMSPASMHMSLKLAYKQLAVKHGLRVIPTGDAVQLFRDRLPVVYGTLLTKKEILDLKQPARIEFHGDVVGFSYWGKGVKGRQQDWQEIKLRCDFPHLNMHGHYLQACVWAAELFGIDPTTINYKPAYLKEADARLMRECARDAIIAW